MQEGDVGKKSLYIPPIKPLSGIGEISGDPGQIITTLKITNPPPREGGNPVEKHPLCWYFVCRMDAQIQGSLLCPGTFFS